MNSTDSTNQYHSAQFYSAGYESVTATFAHGSRGDQFSELRASEIRGLMRYWFRTALAGRIPLRSLEALEGELFGDARQFGERLRINVSFEGSYRDHVAKTRTITPHKDQDLKPKELPSSLNPGIKILIALEALRTEEETPQIAAEHALWLALTLGGVGTRMRRGAGSFVLRGSASSQGIAPEAWATSQSTEEAQAAEWKAYVTRGVGAAFAAFRKYAALRRVEIPQVPQPIDAESAHLPSLQHPNSGLYLLPTLYGDELEFRKEIMLGLRKFKNEAFGLPLRHPGKRPTPGRFASPVWIRGVRVGEKISAQATIIPPFPKHSDAKPELIEAFLTDQRAEKILTFSEMF